MAAESTPLTVVAKVDATDISKGLASAVRSATREVDKLKKQMEGLQSDVPARAARQMKEVGDATRNASQSVKLLGFQLGDIATQIASGTSPMRAFATQAEQLGQALRSAGGLSGGIRALGAALLDPWIAVPLVATAATAAIGAYFSDAETGGKKVNDVLKEQADALDAIAQRYPRLLAAQQAAGRAADAASAAQQAADKQLLLTEAFKGTDAALSALETQYLLARDILRVLLSPEDVNRFDVAWQKLTKAIADHTATVADAQPILDQLREWAKDGSPEIKALADILETALIPALGDAATAAKDINEAMSGAANSFDLMAEAIQRLLGPFGPLLAAFRELAGLADGFSAGGLFLKGMAALPAVYREAITATPSAAKEFLKSKAANAKIRSRIDEYDDNFAVLLTKLFSSLPDSAHIVSGVRTFDEQKRIYDSGVRPAARPGTSHHEQVGTRRPQAADIGGISSGTLQTAVAAVPELETLLRIGDAMHVQLRRGSEDAVKAVKAESTAYTDLVREMQAKIEEQQTENAINADSTASADEKTAALQRQKAALEAVKVEQQLNDAATAQGIVLTDAVKEKNHELAESFAAAGLAADQLATRSKNAAKESADALQSAAQKAQMFADAGRAFFGTFISSMRQGKDATEALNDALGALIDTLLNQALNMLFSPNNFLGLFGGGAGAFPAAPVGLYSKGGIAGSSSEYAMVDPSRFRSAQRFATGGIPHGTIPALLHPGELVIPANLVGRMGRGGGYTDNSRISVGNVAVNVEPGPDQVAATSQQGAALGMRIQDAVRVVLVQEARPGGILSSGFRRQS